MDINRAIALLSNEAARFTASQQRDIHDFICRLAAYEDRSYITAEWLVRNGFEFRVGDKDDKDFYLFCNDVVEISATLHDEEAGEWKIEVTFLDHGDTEKMHIHTLGQFRMFLAVCGCEDIAEELKS